MSQVRRLGLALIGFAVAVRCRRTSGAWPKPSTPADRPGSPTPWPVGSTGAWVLVTRHARRPYGLPTRRCSPWTLFMPRLVRALPTGDRDTSARAHGPQRNGSVGPRELFVSSDSQTLPLLPCAAHSALVLTGSTCPWTVQDPPSGGVAHLPISSGEYENVESSPVSVPGASGPTTLFPTQRA
jgi:hypothetical protein